MCRSRTPGPAGAIAALMMMLVSAPAVAASTVFTYQGRLLESGQPVNGAVDLEFSLWDALSGGSQIGSTIALDAVTVSDGVFTVQLDFGVAAYGTGSHWLEVTVDTVTLSPRQPLHGTPYSIQTRGVFVDAVEQVGIGTDVPQHPLHVTGDAMRVVTGETTAAGDSVGVYGSSSSTTGRGVEGRADSFSGECFGVYGTTGSGNGSGVYGRGPTAGVTGIATSQQAASGVFGQSPFRGVYGDVTRTTGLVYGVYGHSLSTGGVGVYGFNSSFSGTTYGVYGRANSATGYAGYFRGAVHAEGDLSTDGNLSKASGSFLIDHPLDPDNLYLAHSFVESPDMMNVYNGNVTLDERGEATVHLPEYFETLNRDFRYQLTAIGAPGPYLHVAQKIEGNSFRISGGEPGLEVSWQVTGVRQDPWAEQHRIEVERPKPDHLRGKLIHPELYGRPASDGIRQMHDLSRDDPTPRR